MTLAPPLLPPVGNVVVVFSGLVEERPVVALGMAVDLVLIEYVLVVYPFVFCPIVRGLGYSDIQSAPVCLARGGVLVQFARRCPW